MVLMGAPGCDDAPIVTVPLGTEARDITLIMPYYENPVFMVKQYDRLRGLSEDLKRNLAVIIVDDGSPNEPAEGVLSGIAQDELSLKLFRTEVDVRWNWLAARNIGARHAVTKWIMLTDMDHMLPERTLRTLIYGQHSKGTIYRFSRTGTKTHPHPNSWFMTREMYWRVGGYDEALSGHYGTDGEYRRRCAATASVRIMDVPLELHEHEGDSSTVHYLRKQPEDAKAKQLIKARRPGWKPKVLSFPYHEVRL
jgi:hypothetical protein